MQPRRATPADTAVPTDFAPLIDACAKARATLENAKRNRSQRPDRMRAAKTKIADLECARDLLQSQADAGADVDPTKLEMADANLQAARAELDALVRAAHADSVAIDILRNRLGDARLALHDAMDPSLSVLRAMALEKYQAGMQAVRDAVTIVGKIDDELLPFRFRMPSLTPGQREYEVTTPSPEIVSRLLEVDAGIRERDIALQAILR